MKRILFWSLLLLTGFAQAQPFNNEWIDYNKTYYKFSVGSDGLYRISQSVLSGIGLGSTPAEQFQLWRNGEQVPLFTSVATGAMGASDYIEFWGRMNDGRPDKVLYRNQDHQLNDRWSLETDTAVFFLTVNPTGNNLRLVNTANTLPTSATPEPFFYHSASLNHKQRINPGYAAIVGSAVYSSSYDQGEGWTSNDIGYNVTRTDNLTGLFPYTGTGANTPILNLSATGNALNPRTFSISVNSTQLDLATMDYFDYVRRIVSVPTSLIASGTASVAVKNLSTTNPDRMALAKMELLYPRLFNFGGANNFAFPLQDGTAGNYLEITGFTHGGVAPVLYDFTNGQRYVCDIATAGMVKVMLAPAAGVRNLLLVSQATGVPQFVSNLQSRSFVNYGLSSNQGNYLMISHSAILNGTGGTTPVEDYRAYRSSAAGGGYTAKIYMIDQLVDQFAFGIRLHPLSVRNFIRYARATYSSPVKNVLLVGKGVEYTANRGSLSNPDLNRLSFIPTFGNPASDVLLAADPGLNGIPQVSIGRLSVINGDEVRSYLDKVIQYEQHLVFQSPLISDKAWTKNVVHVIGSGDGTLGDVLTNSMNGFTNIISDTAYGSRVHTFSKLSTAPVEQANSARLYNLFEQGIGMLTYFGHSSASTLEFNLDDPDSYNNAGKYPLFVLLGCNAGNFFTFNAQRLFSRETISEKFVLAPQRGSIATIASTGLGIVNYLDIYHGNTLKAASVTKYGQSIGEIMRESITQVFNLTTQDDYFARFHCEQSTLHGDPALILKGSAPKPDYVIEDQQVRINPSFVSVADASFQVEAAILNLGKAINRDMVVEVKRTFPDLSTQVIIRDTISGIRFSDTVRYSIPIQALRDKGLNKISICIDADNTIDELYESNNCITKDVFIYEDEARPVYPYNFAIVNTQNIKLTASTANPFAPLKQYRMEIDTTELFNSPLKATQTLSSTGGVLEFNPGLSFVDSTVYYWRVAPVPTSGQPVWNKSSFLYKLNYSTGFSQSHYFQHLSSVSDRMSMTRAGWRYDSVQNTVMVYNGVWASAITQEAALSITVNNLSYIRSICNFGLVFNVFDKKSFKPWKNQVVGSGGLYQSLSPGCASSRIWNFEYSNDSSGRRKAREFLQQVPDGNMVIMRVTVLNGSTVQFVDKWMADTTVYGPGNTLYHALKGQGVTVLDSFTSLKAVSMIFSKNNPAFNTAQIITRGIFDAISLPATFQTADSVGTITSPVIGPARTWRSLRLQARGDDPADSASVQLVGVTPNGSSIVLFDGISAQLTSFDISSISAIQYPFLQLRMRTKDVSSFTPFQLDGWQVLYDPVPEGALSPTQYFQFADTVDVGQPQAFKIAFQNVSNVSFDSVRVKLQVTDRQNIVHDIPIPRLRAIPGRDTAIIQALIPTASLPGVNTVFLEVNPEWDQPEQYHFNNIAIRNFYVRPDSTDPTLDVTFDGAHIMNQDIVSAQPAIQMQLNDNSRWMLLNDTALITVQVRYPNGQLRRFYFQGDTLQFLPASGAPAQINEARIHFMPHFPLDGEYELLVTAKDRSSNNAGAISYKVRFQIINTPSISNLINYPNPFTSQTAFVFTLTGKEPPSHFKIEILTVTGKVVREITQDELGPLRIGRNITAFRWDGTDQFGQALANGIYLYRIVTHLAGKSLDVNSNTQTDRYFSKGYGKMYLMR
jgi:hypothetical protein